MKKNISINISGIIFHIEEDGYEKFKSYLDSINKYFASYEDNEEIVADIESRIAEIFLEKLDEGKQVISNEDVNELISTMGQVSDFEAMEDETDFASVGNTKEEPKKQAKSEKKQKRKQNRSSRTKVLERDTNNQIIAGVAAGMAYYLNIDPIWIRVLCLVLMPVSIFVYFILWLALPGNDNLIEDETVKKLYRDPDDRVLGGVAAGLAKYFKTDSIVIRVVLIILFFGGGIGLLAYIVLWIITPQANSLTDKMQMKGEKVTLSNIDSTIKKSKEEELNPKGENTFTTILLFPFRLVGKIFSALGKAFAPLLLFIAAAIRIFTGGIISIVGISVMFSLLVSLGVLLGVYNGDRFFHGDEFTDIPFDVIANTFPEVGVVFLLVALFIPFLYVFIAGITIIAKRRVMSSSVGWSILGIWMISVIGAFAVLPNVVRDFTDEGYYEESEIVNIEADTLIIDMKSITSRFDDSRRYRGNWNSDWHSELTDLDLRFSRDDKFTIEKRFRARGRSPRDAENNAQDVNYGYSINGSTISFDSDITFERGAEFRFQELDINFFIPKNQPFKVERGMNRLLNSFSRRFSWWEVYRNVWMFDDSGSLICLSCSENDAYSSTRETGNYKKSKSLESFSTIEVSQNMKVVVSNGNDFRIDIVGTKSKVEEVFVRVADGKLSIDENASRVDWSDIEIRISCPALATVNLKNGAQLEYAPEAGDFFTLNVYDDSKAKVSGQFDKIECYISGNARVDLEATLDNLTAQVTRSGRLYAYNAEAREAKIETSSEARARVNVSEVLNAGASGFSSIRYKGNPELNIYEERNSASISKY